MKSKKKVLGAYNGSFLSNIVERGYSFLISLKGSFKKKFGKPWLRSSDQKLSVEKDPGFSLKLVSQS